MGRALSTLRESETVRVDHGGRGERQPVALHPQPVAWIGLVQFSAAVLIGNLALQYSATRLRANVLSVLMLAEVLVASVSSWLAGAATITAITLLGALLIIGASLLAVVTGPPADKAKLV